MTLAQLLLLINQALGDLGVLYSAVQGFRDKFGADATIEITGMSDDVQAALDRLNK